MSERGLHFGESRLQSLTLIVLAWLLLQVGGMFSPGLLDDVDSVYIEVAREMLQRHDYVTPYVDGVRFFDKPPLMYWMAAASMRVFGEHDWAARLPMVLATLALLLAVYGLGCRLYGRRAGLYSALGLSTAVGPYLYTRFFIPDILICLWMTLGVWFFLVGLEHARAEHSADAQQLPGAAASVVIASVGFGAVLGVNLLTKGLIGLVFPLAFVGLYLVLTRQAPLLRRMRVWASTLTFLLVALPWHVLAALRNPAILMPPGLGLPARAGWAWFYLYNEHVARFLGRRIPHDYGNTPVWLFWVYALIWVMPWGVFLPAAFSEVRRALGHHFPVTTRQREAAVTVTLWAGIVMVFFSVSNRQEYYSLPALPALALMVGGTLAAAEPRVKRAVLLCHRLALLPMSLLIGGVCGYFSVMAPQPILGVDLAALLASNPGMYNVSLGHLFDLTGAAMGLFRGPLTIVALGMLVVGLGSYEVRRWGKDEAANLTLAGGMIVVLMAAHEGLIRFNPILGSKRLANAIVAEQAARPAAGDVIMLDGELTSGSTLLFYTRQSVMLVNGRVNGPWFGSFWADAPKIFVDEAGLRAAWSGSQRVFLMTYDPASRERDLAGARVLAAAGGKTVLVNR